MIKIIRPFIVLCILGIASLQGLCQSPHTFSNPAKNWQNECIEQDSVYGTGSDKALELLKGRTSTPVVVAVIDGGVYIKHPALQEQIWVNHHEIPNNHIDDDKNGYIDDINGWDFIGGKDSDVKQDNIELTRLYRDLSKEFNNITVDKINKKGKKEYARYQKIKTDFEKKRDEIQMQDDNLNAFIDTIGKIKEVLGKNDFTGEDLDAYHPTDSAMSRAKRRLLRNFKVFASFIKGSTADSIIVLTKKGIVSNNNLIKYQYNVDFDPRFIVGDNYTDATQQYYGNNDVIGPTDKHATHVSGIIAGMRTGKPGAQEGIADNVKIMVVRVVPDGDERDKDVANGIRYAVDNGAKVINMSFGKGYSYNKKTVDDAVKYAALHDVLLVHAAGNDHQNNDSVNNYPNPRYEHSHKHAKNWIEVGASDSKGRPAQFSNYGKKTVDLFAPGVKLYSTVPDTGYMYSSGTSMASPSVAGVAAILREYFPRLSAVQVKKIIMKSVTKINMPVSQPGHFKKMVNYSALCISCGIINAEKAVQLAMKKFPGN